MSRYHRSVEHQPPTDKEGSCEPIFVTRPSLPPLTDLIPYLEEIWSSRVLTNGGKFHAELEKALSEKFGTGPVALVNNATIGLILALKALNVSGEVITTPYSFVATSHALLWNGLTPVFVDIDANTLNIDPARIEEAITANTTAILAVHCYGRACDVDAIQEIADRHNLRVIYDAAHAFGTTCHCGSVLNHGDLSILSFHATKIFNTFEGGAIVCKNQAMKDQIDLLKNFGFQSETSVAEVGINGKMNEFSAAIGILQLQNFNKLLEKRKQISDYYEERLTGISGITCLNSAKFGPINYSYFPVLIDENYKMSRDELYERLKSRGVYARRYFYPLLSDLPIYQKLNGGSSKNLLQARKSSNSILCLPMGSDIRSDELERVLAAIEGI